LSAWTGLPGGHHFGDAKTGEGSFVWGVVTGEITLWELARSPRRDVLDKSSWASPDKQLFPVSYISCK